MARTPPPAPLADAAGDDGPPPSGGDRPGTLYVVATPIGNLQDLSARATSVLSTVAWVAAEDTRVSRVLLERIGARARLLAVHAHNERSSAPRLIELLRQGVDVALVSDAGTPAVSDPGAAVVAAAHAAGLPVVPLPGASAPLALLSAAGLPPGPFLFEGFLPPRDTARLRRLGSLRRQLDGLGAHLILFEAPHRIDKTVAALLATFGPARTLVIGRELTKVFEEIHVGPLGEAPAWLADPVGRRRGEFVLIVAAPGTEVRAHGADDQRAGGEPPAAETGMPAGESGAAATSVAAADLDGTDDRSGAADGPAGSHGGGGHDGDHVRGAGLWPLGASQLHDARALLTRLLADLSPSRAVKLAQELTGLGHRDLYDIALELKKDLKDPR